MAGQDPVDDHRDADKEDVDVTKPARTEWTH